jgi:mRNA interferase RelE/StbE
MYRLQFLGKAQEDLKRIDRAHQKIIKEKLLLLAENPESLKNNIKRLKGSKEEYYRLRVGSYRIIFKKEKKRLVIVIIRIGHRKEIYLSLDFIHLGCAQKQSTVLSPIEIDDVFKVFPGSLYTNIIPEDKSKS